MENKDYPMNPQPTAVIVAPQPQQVGGQQAGCCCVPATASGAVKGTRGMSIAILIVHIAALVLGFFLWLQWIASLLAIIMSSIVLCSFSKCAYGTAAALFTVGAILDVVIVVLWLALADQYDSAQDGHGSAVAFLTVPSAIGAATSAIGAVFACKAVGNWSQSGAMVNGASPLPR